MAGFTMPNYTLINPGPIGGPQGYALVPAAGTTLRLSWTATGLVSFTGYFRNKSTNALVGGQVFTNNNGGNYLWSNDAGFNGSNNWVWEFNPMTANGHNITVSFSVDSGTPYSGLKVRRSGGWRFVPVYVRRSGSWIFVPIYIRRSGAWALSHS